MRIITKYILKEQIAPFFIGLTFFTFIFILQKIFRIASLLVVKKVPFFIVFKLFIYAIPFTMAITVPMAMLVAVIMSLGRLSSDGEIIAIRSSGISYITIFIPYIFTGLFLSFLLMIFNDTVLVYANIRFKATYKEIVRQKPLVAFEEKSFTNLGNGVSIWVSRKDEEAKKLFGVLIIQRDENGFVRIYSSEAQVVFREKKYQSLILYNAELGKSTGKKEDYHSIKIYKKLVINIPIASLTKIVIKKGPREMTFYELLKEILAMIIAYKDKEYAISLGGTDKIKKLPLSFLLSKVSLKELLFASYTEDINYYMVELFKKYLIPLACFSFTLIGAPLGIFSKRSGKTASLGMAIGVIFIFYPFLVLGQTFGYSGKLPPFIAIAIPNIVIITVGLLLIFWKNRH